MLSRCYGRPMTTDKCDHPARSANIALPLSTLYYEESCESGSLQDSKVLISSTFS